MEPSIINPITPFDIVQFLANLKVLSEIISNKMSKPPASESSVKTININLNVDLRRKLDVTSATISYQEHAKDGPRREVTRIIDQLSDNLSDAAMEPKLPLGSGRCLIVNNPDLWSDEKQRQFSISDRVCLVAAKANEEIEIVSLQRINDRNSFKVNVSKSGWIRAAIWKTGKFRDYSSSKEQWYALGTSKWRFTILRPDQVLNFNEEDTPYNPRTVIIFDPKIVEEVWHITRHPDRLPDEHYIVIKAL